MISIYADNGFTPNIKKPISMPLVMFSTITEYKAMHAPYTVLTICLVCLGLVSVDFTHNLQGYFTGTAVPVK